MAFVFASTVSFAQNKELIPFEKRNIRLDLKLPHINYPSVSPNGEFRDAKIGFNGYGIGLEYSYKTKKFLETGLSIALTFELPFPAHIDREYNKAIGSYYLSMTDNFVLDRFTIGYGMNYSSNNWSEWYRDIDTIGLPTREGTLYTNKTLGITLNSYYRMGKSLHMGMIYRPTFLKVNGSVEFIHEHLISFELNWRIRLTKKQNSNNQ